MDIDRITEKITYNEILLPHMLVNVALEEVKSYINENKCYNNELNKAVLLMEKASDLLYKDNQDFIKIWKKYLKN